MRQGPAVGITAAFGGESGDPLPIPWPPPGTSVPPPWIGDEQLAAGTRDRAIARPSSGSRKGLRRSRPPFTTREYGETFEAAVAREVPEGCAADPLEIETLGVRNVLRGDPVVSPLVAVVFAVLVEPAQVAIGTPHNFDELDWFVPDGLPEPSHSQLAERLALFRPAQRARRRKGAVRMSAPPPSLRAVSP
jgi:ADP-ribose pyrophosphatase YjhB (NUDIX family)